MFNDKKGVELTLNMIIVIVLGLIIVAVGVYLIINSGTSVNNATDCGQNSGKCVGPTESCDADYATNFAYKCIGADKGKKCCIPMARG